MQIKCYIKEIHYFQISFNGDFESTIFKGFNEYLFHMDLLQQLLKNGLEIIKNISSTSNKAKILSCRNIYGH